MRGRYFDRITQGLLRFGGWMDSDGPLGGSDMSGGGIGKPPLNVTLKP